MGYSTKLAYTFFSAIAWVGSAAADDYRLIHKPTYQTGTAHVTHEFEKPTDPNVCKLYLRNLRYFAQRDVPLSCSRPIAPNLSAFIKAVEWEDLDPLLYPELFAAVVREASFGRESTDDVLRYKSEEVRKGISVFRRAKVALKGTFDNGHQGPTSEEEPFSIVQYGINTLATDNPQEFSRCIPQRGGRDSYNDDLRLYIAAADLRRLMDGELQDYQRNGNTGEYLRLINGELYVEQLLPNGDSILMQVRTQFPIGLDSICQYKFKKS